MSLPFIPTAREASAIRVCYLFPPRWRLWGFFCEELWIHMFANAHVMMSAMYFYVHVRVSVRVGSFLLNFQRIQTAHTLLQHIMLWHSVSVRYTQCFPSSPSLSHFPVLLYWELSSLAQYVLLLHFIGAALRGGVFLFCFFQQPHIGNYTKLKIIAWPANACAAQTRYILGLFRE